MKVGFLVRVLWCTLALAGSGPVAAQSIAGQGTWETTLLGRDINLNAVAASSADAVYLFDTAFNITWLRNANLNGPMNWATAASWADQLSTGSGAATLSDWRLPAMTLALHNCSYFGPCEDYGALSTSEISRLYTITLGNTALSGLSNVGSFQNFQSAQYWTSDTLNLWGQWYFDTSTGLHDASTLPGFNQFYALAVRNGDVLAAVPEPETYLLLLAGLGWVAVTLRRRKMRASIGLGNLCKIAPCRSPLSRPRPSP